MIFVAFLILLCLLYISGVYGFAGILFVISIYFWFYIFPKLVMLVLSKDFRQETLQNFRDRGLFLPRSTWSERAGGPHEDMTEKEYRAYIEQEENARKWRRNNS